MITLDPEFVGTLAPPTKLTTTLDGKVETPYARLPRIERLRVSGKADETELADADEGAEEAAEADTHANTSKAAKEKNKMRGKNKSLKRYLRKHRKNVIDPQTVRTTLTPLRSRSNLGIPSGCCSCQVRKGEGRAEESTCYCKWRRRGEETISP
jgi:hypothetical protein